MNRQNKTKKKAVGSIVTITVLFCMLAITTYALIFSLVSVDNNQFDMGRVKIELNGGQRIFDGSDLNIEPGYTIKRDFTVENKSTVDVYYRLYMENVTGSLQEVLTFEVYDGDELLFRGKADKFTKESICQGSEPLSVGETRTLTMLVKMDENAGNEYQNGGITFDMTADAVQVRNNPDKQFE